MLFFTEGIREVSVVSRIGSTHVGHDDLVFLSKCENPHRYRKNEDGTQHHDHDVQVAGSDKVGTY